MTLHDLIALTDARITFCAQRRTVALSVGDVQTVARLDAEIAQTEATRATLIAALTP
ncbi:MAG: hypothetical protein ACK5X2_05765 [Gemmatimonadaceae bacterium]|jgi:hypothetical protein